jgi:MFS family permease
VTPASATGETTPTALPPHGPANDVREENRKPTQPEAPAIAPTARLAKTELVPARDPALLALAASRGVAVDGNGEFDLTYGELLAHPMTWLLTIFFTTILTPGWGIKLSSVAIMRTFFQASVAYAEQITALYSAFYCVGRFVGGLVAERIGNSRTYDVMLVFMLVCLVIAPQTTTSLPHGDVASLGSQVFVGLLCIIGLMYGGCVALLYSIVFDVFGAKNYRVVLGFNLQGYAWSTLVGGVSSAYSFSSSSADVMHRPDVPGQAANQWFYAMAGATLFGLVLLHVLRPLDFNTLLHRRLAHLDPV